MTKRRSDLQRNLIDNLAPEQQAQFYADNPQLARAHGYGGAKKPKTQRGRYEEDIQIAFIQLCDFEGEPYNEVFAVPNGGKRGKAEAARLKRGGVRAGEPDTYLLIPNESYHGMAIEFKRREGIKPSPDQVKRHKKLRDRGYYVFVAWDEHTAFAEMKKYLENKV